MADTAGALSTRLISPAPPVGGRDPGPSDGVAGNRDVAGNGHVANRDVAAVAPDEQGD